jgi:hypothetical protein
MNPIICFSAEDHRGWDALFVAEDRAFERSRRYRPLFLERDPEPIKSVFFSKSPQLRAVISLTQVKISTTSKTCDKSDILRVINPLNICFYLV